MSFLSSLTEWIPNVWTLVWSSAAGELFLFSTLFIILGLAWEVWFQGLNVCTFSGVSLKDIEKRHPHVPSLMRLGLILLNNLELYAISLLFLKGFIFRHDPREWMFFSFIFVFSITVTVLIELYWRSVAEMLLAFSTGTAAAFLLLVLKISLQMRYPAITAAFAVLLFVNMAWMVLLYNRSRDRWPPMFFVMTLLVWIVFHFLSI